MTNVLAPLAKVDCMPAFDAIPMLSKSDTISIPLKANHKRFRVKTKIKWIMSEF